MNRKKLHVTAMDEMYTNRNKYNDDDDDVAMKMLTTAKRSGDDDNIISGIFWLTIRINCTNTRTT